MANIPKKGHPEVKAGSGGKQPAKGKSFDKQPLPGAKKPAPKASTTTEPSFGDLAASGRGGKPVKDGLPPSSKSTPGAKGGVFPVKNKGKSSGEAF